MIIDLSKFLLIHMSQDQGEQEIIKDILNPYFEIGSDQKCKCTVYGPQDQVRDLRKIIENEIGVTLPEDINSFTFVVK